MLQDKKVLVLGLGVSGRAVASKCVAERAHVIASDTNMNLLNDPEVQSLRDSGAEVRLGTQGPDLADEADLVVPSPGIPPTHPVIARALQQGKPVISEIELAYQLLSQRGGSPAPGIIAVTGTDGKSTATKWIEHVLKTAGLKAVAAGNIGPPFIQVLSEPLDRVVLEVSSFQLAAIRSFRPHIAVLLNVDVDHLNWHSDAGDYKRAKLRVFENQTPEDFSILNADEAVYAEAARATRGRLCPYSLNRTDSSVAWVEGGRIHLWKDPGEPGAPADPVAIVDTAALPTVGAINVSNALAVAIASRLAGAPLEAVAEGLRTFKPLSHRIEFCGEYGGMRFYDDSKGTTPHASIAAMKALAGGPWLTLILGGSEKNLDYTELSALAARLCHAVVLTGEAGARMFQAFERIPLHGNGKRQAFVVVERDFDRAVERAIQVTPEGGIVLLSPACASFDSFKNYAERGDFFKRKVREFAVPVHS